jgi:hypothetical protein
LLLHRPGRKADLSPHLPASGSKPMLNIYPLNLVSEINPADAKLLSEGRNSACRLFSFTKADSH